MEFEGKSYGEQPKTVEASFAWVVKINCDASLCDVGWGGLGLQGRCHIFCHKKDEGLLAFVGGVMQGYSCGSR